MRLIDADALIGSSLETKVKSDFRDVKLGYEIAMEIVKQQPTIDAVPVIRCKDCARNPKYTARTHCPCPMDRYMGDDGWCAMARRKENA